MNKDLKKLKEEWRVWVQVHRTEHNALADRIIHWKEGEDYTDPAVYRRERQARTDMVIQFCQDTLGWTKEEATCWLNRG